MHMNDIDLMTHYYTMAKQATGGANLVVLVAIALMMTSSMLG